MYVKRAKDVGRLEEGRVAQKSVWWDIFLCALSFFSRPPKTSSHVPCFFLNGAVDSLHASVARLAKHRMLIKFCRQKKLKIIKHFYASEKVAIVTNTFSPLRNFVFFLPREPRLVCFPLRVWLRCVLHAIFFSPKKVFVILWFYFTSSFAPQISVRDYTNFVTTNTRLWWVELSQMGAQTSELFAIYSSCFYLFIQTSFSFVFEQ
jgi:hypothetical protein